MPELPEVETVKRGLEQLLLGTQKSVVSAVKTSRKQLRFPWPRGFRQKLEGEQIIALHRRAKYLLFQTTHQTFLSHLGMTGSWRLEPVGSTPRTHDHLFLELNGKNLLIYNDPRRFGFVDLLKSSNIETEKWFKHLGPEPLDAKLFEAEYLFQKSRNKKTTVKAFLMDQTVVVGVGNIYASEALFRAGVLPTKPAQKLTRNQCARLVEAITRVLNEAIEQGGTTIRDFRSAGGSEGYFQQKLFVYGRDGDPCLHCNTLIQKQVIVGRSTFWCRRCQK